ncbi:MAG TPA: VirB3 family type IV secretion system protein [Gemmatimonadaceae bacterium]|nr:VirB3 family type IV secretion system protein [Gemmatimonadaceae bacterium]
MNKNSNSTGLELHVIHASLYRPVLFAGAEPGVVILEIATSFALVFGVGIHVATIGLAAFYLTALHSIMVSIAKEEPQMIALYVRSLSGHDFYFAHADIQASLVVPKPSIPSVK